MRTELLVTRLWRLELDRRSGVAFLHRTREPLRSMAELREENRLVIEAFRLASGAGGIVVDVRLARPCATPEFESAMERLRTETYSGFTRVALLVRTAVGRLQVSRLGATRGENRIATTDEKRALLFARGQLPSTQELRAQLEQAVSQRQQVQAKDSQHRLLNQKIVAIPNTSESTATVRAAQ
jgi:hypothetical protein